MNPTRAIERLKERRSACHVSDIDFVNSVSCRGGLPSLREPLAFQCPLSSLRPRTRAHGDCRHGPNHPTEPSQGEQNVARCSEDVRNAVGMRRKTLQIIRGIYKGGETDVDIDAQIKWEREKAEKRRIWEEDFARRKEEERLRLAREELAREKKHRLDSWMSNGGDLSDFERAGRR
jgi:hypothetical protein